MNKWLKESDIKDIETNSIYILKHINKNKEKYKKHPIELEQSLEDLKNLSKLTIKELVDNYRKDPHGKSNPSFHLNAVIKSIKEHLSAIIQKKTKPTRKMLDSYSSIIMKCASISKSFDLESIEKTSQWTPPTNIYLLTTWSERQIKLIQSKQIKYKHQIEGIRGAVADLGRLSRCTIERLVSDFEEHPNTYTCPDVQLNTGMSSIKQCFREIFKEQSNLTTKIYSLHTDFNEKLASVTTHFREGLVACEVKELKNKIKDLNSVITDMEEERKATKGQGSESLAAESCSNNQDGSLLNDIMSTLKRNQSNPQSSQMFSSYFAEKQSDQSSSSHSASPSQSN
ncbi:hypothetical protein AVI51_12325 [Piscirickettsia salmonis]|uniref:hypothetical protein n=1 Tax=Piscirickettsia salmonis TaxID=1238 RepID=UPI0006BD90B6|nr:hypothetical protein [Piscirickettsia salmonis]ALA26199.1 mce related family protein [Piscirickettsia salmonis]APS43641.1 hypothetical protein AVI48_04150 [Piscirickettsia salmonis]APS46996.1 hypothetical protein AVI49_04760 [Piscirickettsia salmonis]APS51555.1 hypothetical protein AVI50_12435 [Piscirickettsia salmonis]APS54769.1 hypothetical protein AVI51_12325 [Piscirickettsia salmonis]